MTVTAGPRLQQQMLRWAGNLGRSVSLTLTSLKLDYQLTRKGRLVLNSAAEPNWQVVESEDALVHRYLSLSPAHVLAASTTSACSVYDYESRGHGIFYIPIETPGVEGQHVDITAAYRLSYGYEGEVTTTVDLSRISEPSRNHNLRITLEIPEPECPGATLANASVGMIICSHGRAHAATTDGLVCGGRKVAVVAYKGSDTGVSGYTRGLALAMKDANAEGADWCAKQPAEICLAQQAGDEATALGFYDGLTSTNDLEAHATHSHAAAHLALNYQYSDAVVEGAHPAGTSQWFLPAMGQWNEIVKGLTGLTRDLDSSQHDGEYKADNVNPTLTAAGADGFEKAHYWTSTESGNGGLTNAWYVSFKDGKINSEPKTTATTRVRAAFAF